MQIERKVEDELKKCKECLYEQNINGFDVEETKKLIDEYFENNGILIDGISVKCINSKLIEFERIINIY